MPVAARMAVGVARPKAHGHAMTRTDTELINAVSSVTPAINHMIAVNNAITKTTGTKIALMRSTKA